nr:hypothetical protein [Sporomusa silvacetica]
MKQRVFVVFFELGFLFALQKGRRVKVLFYIAKLEGGECLNIFLRWIVYTYMRSDVREENKKNRKTVAGYTMSFTVYNLGSNSELH